MSYSEEQVHESLVWYTDLVVNLLGTIEGLNDKLLRLTGAEACTCEDCPPEEEKKRSVDSKEWELDGEAMVYDAEAWACGCGKVAYPGTIIYSHCPIGSVECPYCDRDEYVVHYRGNVQAACAYAAALPDVLEPGGDGFVVYVESIEEYPDNEA